MPQFLSRFPQISHGGGFYKGLMTAMIELGALFGALNQGWIADRISRKYSIVVAVCIFLAGSVLQTAAVDYEMLTFARFVGGVGIGMLSMVAPLYISEISPPEIRGTLLVLEELSIVTGIVVAFWTTYATRLIGSEWAWRLPFLLQMFPGLVLGVGIVFLPFSPRWLCSKGRDQEALRALTVLRQLPAHDRRVQLEWFDIRTEVALHAEISAERHPSLQGQSVRDRFQLELAGWADLFKSGCWRRTMVGSGLMFFQQVSLPLPSISTSLTDKYIVRRDQRLNLLQPLALLADGPNIQYHTPHVRRPKLHPTSRRPHLPLEHGPHRPAPAPPSRKPLHVARAHCHRSSRRRLLARLVLPPNPSLGQRRHAALLHARFRLDLGSRAVGYAF